MSEKINIGDRVILKMTQTEDRAHFATVVGVSEEIVHTEHARFDRHTGEELGRTPSTQGPVRHGRQLVTPTDTQFDELLPLALRAQQRGQTSSFLKQLDVREDNEELMRQFGDRLYAMRSAMRAARRRNGETFRDDDMLGTSLDEMNLLDAIAGFKTKVQHDV